MSFIASLIRALFFKKQKAPDGAQEVSPVKAATVAGSIIAAIMAFVQPWEGRRFVAYQDVVGVWTICDGHTKGVKQGDTATPEQCDKWLAEEIAEFNAGVRGCVTRPMKPNQEVAFTSLAYNIGITGFCMGGSYALMLPCVNPEIKAAGARIDQLAVQVVDGVADARADFARQADRKSVV